MKEHKNTWANRIKRNTISLAYWAAAYIISMAIATFGPIFMWNYNTVLTMVAILINLAVGAGMILANKRHLKGLDELHQKIQLESMAIALDVGIVGGLSYSLLDQTHVINFNAEISHLVILMALTYLAGIIIGRIRYQ